jgi:hypothetical protein
MSFSFALSRSPLANDIQSLIGNITNDNEIAFGCNSVLHTHTHTHTHIYI